MDITPEDFERFLTWLDPDREQAIAKYEQIRARLIKYFACRGWGVEAEDLADETINRVIVKMRELAKSYIGDRLPYFLSVARYVNKERYKRYIEEERQKRMHGLLQPLVTDSSTEKEKSDRCLARCMKQLTKDKRNLILRYYTGEKHDKIEERKRLADELGVAPNALRIRAHRIRTDLRHCLEKCSEEENVPEENAPEDSVDEDSVDEANKE